MRVVRAESIWLHGSYRFAHRDQLRAALAAAKILMNKGFAGAPLSLQCSIVDDNQLVIELQIPMFEEDDFAAALFGLLARCSELTAIETRVDVL